jgi:hypothetical protein
MKFYISRLLLGLSIFGFSFYQVPVAIPNNNASNMRSERVFADTSVHQCPLSVTSQSNRRPLLIRPFDLSILRLHTGTG